MTLTVFHKESLVRSLSVPLCVSLCPRLTPCHCPSAPVSLTPFCTTTRGWKCIHLFVVFKFNSSIHVISNGWWLEPISPVLWVLGSDCPTTWWSNNFSIHWLTAKPWMFGWDESTSENLCDRSVSRNKNILKMNLTTHPIGEWHFMIVSCLVCNTALPLVSLGGCLLQLLCFPKCQHLCLGLT